MDEKTTPNQNKGWYMKPGKVRFELSSAAGSPSFCFATVLAAAAVEVVPLGPTTPSPLSEDMAAPQLTWGVGADSDPHANLRGTRARTSKRRTIISIKERETNVTNTSSPLVRDKGAVVVSCREWCLYRDEKQESNDIDWPKNTERKKEREKEISGK